MHRLARRGVGRIRVLLGCMVFLVFCVSPVAQISDSKYSMLMADSLLRYGSADLSRYLIPGVQAEVPKSDFQTDRTCRPFEFPDARTYQLGYVRGKVVYCYPHGSSWLSVPFLALMELGGLSPATPDLRFDLFGEIVTQRLLASLLMAAMTILVFEMGSLLLNDRWSVVVAIGFAFGTQVWSTATRALWAHTWEIALGGAVVYLLLRAELYRTGIRPILLATLLAWMYFVRPTGAIPAVCVAIYIAIFHRRDLVRLILVGLAWFAAFTIENLWVTGRLTPLYYIRSDFSWRYPLAGIPGNLISPNRGLLVYVPTLFFVTWILVRYWRAIELRRLALLALAVTGGILLMVSSYAVWWGGECYGARFMSDALPWLVMLAILGLNAIPPARRTVRTNPAIALGLLMLVLSIAINSVGAISLPTITWTEDVPFEHAQNILDWSYPQFMAGFTANPYRTKGSPHPDRIHSGVDR